MDFPTITVHAGKCYKALIDSGAAISLLRYSIYQHIDDSFKTPIQPTTAKLNTVGGSPMTALGMTALHLRIADFKFTHNFIICDRLLNTEIIFGLDIQKKFSILFASDKAKEFLTYTRNCKQKATILSNQPLKYHPDIMVLYQLKSQVKQLRNIWLTSLQKEGTLISRSSMASITSKKKHLLIL